MTTENTNELEGLNDLGDFNPETPVVSEDATKVEEATKEPEVSASVVITTDKCSIDFGGHTLAEIEFADGKFKVNKAVSGHGDVIDPVRIKIKSL